MAQPNKLGGSLFQCVSTMLAVAFILCIVLLTLLLINLQEGQVPQCEENPTTNPSASTTEDHEPSPGSYPSYDENHGRDGEKNNSSVLDVNCSGAETESVTLEYFHKACTEFLNQDRTIRAEAVDSAMKAMPNDTTMLLSTLTLLDINPFFQVERRKDGRYILKKPSIRPDDITLKKIVDMVKSQVENQSRSDTTGRGDLPQEGLLGLMDEIQEDDTPGPDNNVYILSGIPKVTGLMRQLLQLQPSAGNDTVLVVHEVLTQYTKDLMEYIRKSPIEFKNIMLRIMRYYMELQFLDIPNDNIEFECKQIASTVMKPLMDKEYLFNVAIEKKDEAKAQVENLFEEAKSELISLLRCLIDTNATGASLSYIDETLSKVALRIIPKDPDEKFLTFDDEPFIEKTREMKMEDSRRRLNLKNQDNFQHLTTISYIKRINSVYVPVEYMEMLIDSDIPHYITVAKIGFELTRALTDAVTIPVFKTFGTFDRDDINKQNPLPKSKVWDKFYNNTQLTDADKLAIRAMYNIAFRKSDTTILSACYNAPQQFFITLAQTYCDPELAHRYFNQHKLTPEPYRISLALATFPTFFKTFGCENLEDRCMAG